MKTLQKKRNIEIPLHSFISNENVDFGIATLSIEEGIGERIIFFF
jgi:hypothetical protein